MKKNVKVKSLKGSKKRSAAVPEPPLPSLVEAMVKLVERLEIVERKMDQVLGRVSNIPSEIRNAVQQAPRPQQSHVSQPQYTQTVRSDQGHTQMDGRKERVMYQAVCADCRKSCEVPFKPGGDRPVYCKECFAIRKAGHRSQDPDQRSQKKSSYVPSALSPDAIPTLAKSVSVFPTRKQKQKFSAKAGAKSKRKKK